MAKPLAKCIECGFPTRELWVIIPGGRSHPLCRKCCNKIPKSCRNPFQQIIDESEAQGKRKVRGKYKVTSKLAEKARTLRDAGMGYMDISRELGVSVGTVYRICREV